MIRDVHKLLQLFIVAISLLWGGSLLAAGFYISEVGTPASMGTAGVGNSTNTEGASAAWSNPAGMTGLTEDSIMAGLMVIVPEVEFDSSVATAGGSDGGNAGEVATIPSFFYTRVLSDDTRFGFSVVAPFGGGIDYGDDFAGRYAVQNVELGGVALTPSFAYKVDERLSVGFGVSAIYTRLEQDIAINTGTPQDGQAKFEDFDDWGYQGILSLTYVLTADTLLGVVYRSEADVDLEGDLKIRDTGTAIPTKSAGASWTNPQWLEAGIRHRLDADKTLMFNLGWQEWSRFDDTISVSSAGISETTGRQWDDTWHAGAAYSHVIDPESLYTLGISYESSPVKDKHRTLDFPVDEMWKLAGSYAWKGKNNFDYSIGATLYMMGDASVDQTAQGVRTKGEFDQNTLLFLGGTFRYIF
jgi:long-chain fatty acid transport protein